MGDLLPALEPFPGTRIVSLIHRGDPVEGSEAFGGHRQGIRIGGHDQLKTAAELAREDHRYRCLQCCRDKGKDPLIMELWVGLIRESFAIGVI